MKNQYFGDRRDLLKYDLLLTLIEVHGAGRLTFIPMLTPDDDSGEGRLKQADRGEHRADLFEFLKQSVVRGERDVKQLRSFMSFVGVELMAYRDDAWFVDRDRREYFDVLPAEYLRRSVIFIDPDIGLETGSLKYRSTKGREKYLSYSELSATWLRAADDSAIIVYQHLQKNERKRPDDVHQRLVEVSNRLGSATFAVRKRDLAFIVAAKSEDCADRFRIKLHEYAQRHGMVFSEVGRWDTSGGPQRLSPSRCDARLGAMGKVERIEQEVQGFSAEELAQFRAWFLEYDWAAWDRQIERDVRAGRLDDPADKALRDHAAGKTKPL